MGVGRDAASTPRSPPSRSSRRRRPADPAWLRPDRRAGAGRRLAGRARAGVGSGGRAPGRCVADRGERGAAPSRGPWADHPPAAAPCAGRRPHRRSLARGPPRTGVEPGGARGGEGGASARPPARWAATDPSRANEVRSRLLERGPTSDPHGSGRRLRRLRRDLGVDVDRVERSARIGTPTSSPPVSSSSTTWTRGSGRRATCRPRVCAVRLAAAASTCSGGRWWRTSWRPVLPLDRRPSAAEANRSSRTSSAASATSKTSRMIWRCPCRARTSSATGAAASHGSPPRS